MKYEQFKTVTLVALICLSLFFTYQLWTYQPSMQALESESDVSESYANSMIGEERAVTELIQPSSMILHKDDQGYALMNRVDNRFEETLGSLRSHGLEHAISADPVQTSAQGIELRFPDEIPLQSLLAFFDEDYDQMNTNREVDRLLIYVAEDEHVNLTFASAEKEDFMSMRSSMPASELKNLIYANDTEAELETEVVKENDSDYLLLRNDIYVPVEKQVVRLYDYTLNMDSDMPMLINQRLFSGTDVPRANQLNGEYLFTDGSRTVTHDSTISYLNYSYPYSTDSQEESSRHILEVGQEFINATGGWTDQYAVDQVNKKDSTGQIEFRLHVNHLPVHEYRLTTASSDQDRMKMYITRAGTQVISMGRPLFQLQDSYTHQEREVASGVDAVELLKSSSSVLWEDVKDVRLGYKATMTSRNRAELSPAWFYKANGDWKPIEKPDEELPG
ncbi:YycH family regulatory protein [Shouchella sp. JSM 1781072]|uniref:YycH family regulatory protein n=1 Tax=Bacillaceae TaxID=186817 RepID=UPI000C071B45|nr:MULTISPECIES: two-component system activity regulator YycH [Bacillaceae]UTR06465.1 two-component system activity regulator YycH [Alkalihalobacillus sp. LMS6]